MPSSPAPIITTVGELSDEALEALADLLISAWRREQAALAAADRADAEGTEANI